MTKRRRQGRRVKPWKRLTDSQRLDFISQRDGRVTRWSGGRWNCAVSKPEYVEGEGGSLRIAIDRAIRALARRGYSSEQATVAELKAKVARVGRLWAKDADRLLTQARASEKLTGELRAALRAVLDEAGVGAHKFDCKEGYDAACKISKPATPTEGCPGCKGEEMTR